MEIDYANAIIENHDLNSMTGQDESKLHIIAQIGRPVPWPEDAKFARFARCPDSRGLEDGAYSSGESDVIDCQISRSGTTVFRAQLEGTAVTSENDCGIWSYQDNSLLLVAREGGRAVGFDDGVTYAEFSAPELNDKGQIAFWARVQGDGIDDFGDEAIWSNRAGRLEIVVREGDQAPGTEAVFASVRTKLWGRSVTKDAFYGWQNTFDATQAGPIAHRCLLRLNNYGKIAFCARIGGDDVGPYSDEGVWSDRTGSLAAVLREGATIRVGQTRNAQLRSRSYGHPIAGIGYSEVISHMAFNDDGVVTLEMCDVRSAVPGDQATEQSDRGTILIPYGSDAQSLFIRDQFPTDVLANTVDNVFFRSLEDIYLLRRAGQSFHIRVHLANYPSIHALLVDGLSRRFAFSGYYGVFVVDGSKLRQVIQQEGEVIGLNDAGHVAFIVNHAQAAVRRIKPPKGVFLSNPDGTLATLVQFNEPNVEGDDNIDTAARFCHRHRGNALANDRQLLLCVGTLQECTTIAVVKP